MNLFRSLLFLFMSISALTASAAEYRYSLSWDENLPFTFLISLETEAASGAYTDFKIPAWRPGRYILQDYAGAVSMFSANDAGGQALKWVKTDKDTWRVQNPAKGGAVKINYRFYSRNVDAGSSVVVDTMCYINGSNLFMYVDKRLDDPCTLTLPKMPKKWKVASGLTKTRTHNVFTAKNYHELVDCPSIFSPDLIQFDFETKGLKCYIHFQGRYGAEKGAEKTLIENFKKIVETQHAVFGDFPTKDYHFIYLLVPFQMRHAVEHQNSAMFCMPDGTTSSADAFKGLYGITSHEFWHLWNVKSIRPAAMWPYDYSKQAYTRLHWFTEGVTDYYAYLMLARSGVNTNEQFLDFLSGNMTSLENNYAAKVVCAEDQSFDTWLTTSPYAHPHHRISFYTSGAHIGFLFDVKLRTMSGGKTSLDDVFRYLYENYYKKNLGVPEDGVQKAAEKLVGKSLEDFFAKYVRGLAPFAVDDILKPFGLEVSALPNNDAKGYEKIGIMKVNEMGRGLVELAMVKPGSDAANSGLREEDVLLGCNGQPCDANTFANLQPGQTVKIDIQRGYSPKQIELKYTGESVPKKYLIRPIKGGDLKFYESWLK